MKRDMDLVRELLLRIEAQHISAGSVILLSFDGPPLKTESENVDEVAYAVRMIEGAGFLDTTNSQPGRGIAVFGLTWRGHDFLDSVRDPEIWLKAKEGARMAGGFTVELLGALARGFLKTQIERHTGVQL